VRTFCFNTAYNAMLSSINTTYANIHPFSLKAHTHRVASVIHGISFIATLAMGVRRYTFRSA
jgi:hypothetical protein